MVAIRCQIAEKKMIKRSLLTKLMAALTVAMVLTAIIITFINYQMAAVNLHKKFETDSTAMVELTNSSLLEAVFAYDFQQVEAIAKSLVNTSLITHINIVDQRGQSMAKAQDEDRSSGQVAQTAIPIIYNGNNIGSYDITFSTNEMQQM